MEVTIEMTFTFNIPDKISPEEKEFIPPLNLSPWQIKQIACRIERQLVKWHEKEQLRLAAKTGEEQHEPSSPGE